MTDPITYVPIPRPLAERIQQVLAMCALDAELECQRRDAAAALDEFIDAMYPFLAPIRNREDRKS